MIDVFMEREWPSPLTEPGFWQEAEGGLDCMPLYNVKWLESYLAVDGSRLVCHFHSPDLESIRTYLRQTDTAYVAVWSGSAHDVGLDLEPNVLVERNFDEAVTLDSIQAMEDAGAQCLQMRQVTFITTLFSRDRKRMLCLYHAPDAQSVREAQEEAGMPWDRVWACKLLQSSEN